MLIRPKGAPNKTPRGPRFPRDDALSGRRFDGASRDPGRRDRRLWPPNRLPWPAPCFVPGVLDHLSIRLVGSRGARRRSSARVARSASWSSRPIASARRTRSRSRWRTARTSNVRSAPHRRHASWGRCLARHAGQRKGEGSPPVRGTGGRPVGRSPSPSGRGSLDIKQHVVEFLTDRLDLVVVVVGDRRLEPLSEIPDFLGVVLVQVPA